MAKIGRPRKRARSEIREKVLTIRLTKGEYRDIERSAKDAGAPLSDWVRSALVKACHTLG